MKALRRRLARRVVLGIVGLLILTMAVVITVLVRAPTGSRIPHLDPEAINLELRDMVGSDGRVYLPPTFSEGSLENTAFAFDVARQIGEPWEVTSPVAELITQSLDTDPASIWVAYYAFLIRRLPISPPAGWDPFLQPDGTYVDHVLSSDPAYAILTTWAAITAGAPPQPELTRTMLAYLSDCTLQEYVLAHAVLTISLSEPTSSDDAMDALAACIDDRSTVKVVAVAPSNEGDLLGLVGRAMALSMLGWPAPAAADTYREALSEQDWFWSDPWWTHYSLLGYCAAGGGAGSYERTLARLASLADRGVVPVISTSQASLDSDLLATLIAKRTGGPWTGVAADAVGLLPGLDEATRWLPDDWAKWGWLSKQSGLDLSPEDNQRVLAMSCGCATGDAELVSPRQLWVCRSACDAYGGQQIWLDQGTEQQLIDHSAWAVVEREVLLGSLEPSPAVDYAINEIAGAPGEAATHTLAQALCLAVATKNQGAQASLIRELDGRLAAGSALFTALRDDKRTPDLWATYWALEASARLATK